MEYYKNIQTYKIPNFITNNCLLNGFQIFEILMYTNFIITFLQIFYTIIQEIATSVYDHFYYWSI